MAIRIPTRSSPRGRHAARPAVRLSGLTPVERATLGSLIVIAVHAANTAAGAGTFGAGLLALGGLAGLGRLFVAGGNARRIVIAGGTGLGALVMCLAVDGPDAAMNGIGRTGVTGLASGVAGVVLLGVAFRLAFAGRRRRFQLLAIPVVLVMLQWVAVPAFNVGVITNAPRAAVRPASSLGYAGARDVSFPASDGVPLAAWFIPGSSGAVVIVMHGSHGTRADELPYVRLLADAGYGVLAIDARGHGESGGRTNALGWLGDRDVAGAVGFLRRQPGVDPARIAGLGLSMGAEELLRATANGVPLAAVVADGAGAATAGDARTQPNGVTAPIADSVGWLTDRGVELLSGAGAPAPLKDIVQRVSSPVMLIASNAPDERWIDERFRRLIGASASVWYVPDAGHTQAFDVHRTAYRARVLGFLGRALGTPGGR
jgi:dienelactone hydrolase